MKKITSYSIVSLIALLFVLCLHVPSFAAIKLETNSYTFKKGSPHIGSVYTDISSYIFIEDAKSNDPNIVTIQSYGDQFVHFKPVNVGTCYITVKGDDGTTTNVKVTVTKEFLNTYLTYGVHLNDNHYGTKKMQVCVEEAVDGLPAKVIIGNDTYNIKKLTASGNNNVKLKRRYKLNTPVKVIITDGNRSGTSNLKIESDTSLTKIVASGKKAKITVWNVHKGDILSFKYKGKTYKKKFTSDKNMRNYTFTLNMKKSLSKNAKFTVRIKNKYKQTLTKQKVKLKKGIYF